MTTLILTASQIEAKPFEGTIDFHQDSRLPLSRGFGGYITGVGKINSLINLQKVLEQNTVKQIIVCGVGGCRIPRLSATPFHKGGIQTQVSPLIKEREEQSDGSGFNSQIGDIVIATNTIDGDIGYIFDDGTREHLKFPVDGLIQETSKELIDELKTIAEKTNFDEVPEKIQEINNEFGNTRVKPKVFCVPIVTGDCFYHGEKLSNWTKELVKEKTGQDNWLTDMEAHAIVSLANSRNIPVAVVKAISNYDQQSIQKVNVAPPVKGAWGVHNSFKLGGLDYAINNSAKLVLTWLKEKA